jgi:hypothetical protein
MIISWDFHLSPSSLKEVRESKIPLSMVSSYEFKSGEVSSSKKK